MFVLDFGSSTCYFFFFKQKTAYEMRISDWSSDVCSSDLLVAAVGDPAVGLQQDGRAEEAVGIPPVAGAGGRAAGAEDALIEAVELLALFGRLLALARRVGTLGLHPRLDRGVLRAAVGKVRPPVLHHRHLRLRIGLHASDHS